MHFHDIWSPETIAREKPKGAVREMSRQALKRLQMKGKNSAFLVLLSDSPWIAMHSAQQSGKLSLGSRTASGLGCIDALLEQSG